MTSFVGVQIVVFEEVIDKEVQVVAWEDSMGCQEFNAFFD